MIQQKGILPIIKKKDTIAQAQSGSGKTGTFVIGCLQLIDTTSSNLQGLILAPTRELAKQICDVNILPHFEKTFLPLKNINLLTKKLGC